ncbi:MAG: hypothetical protein LBK25_08535 [Treponema sp.]|nr:hypothetical protein [Treponema sp.]
MKKLNNKVWERIMVKKVMLKKVLGIAAVMLGTLVTACSESESEPEPKPVLCECVEKEHWDGCDCPADAGKCDCTVIEYKTLTNGIRVYRGDGVMGEQMDAAVVNVQNGWDGLDTGDAALMNGKIERIIIVSGANGLEAADAKWVVKLGATQDAAAITAVLKNYLDTQIDPVLCECEETEHWDVCDCGAGEEQCACTVIEYKTLTNEIRVYRGDGVPGEQMDAAVVNVQNGWTGLDAGDAALIQDKVERIIVVSGANGLEAADAKWVVKLGATQDAAAVTAALKNYLDTQIDPLCVCVEKNHLGIGETCECDGLRDCDCGLQVYGTLGDAANTPIYRSGDVSDTDMATAVANAQSAYNMLDDGSIMLLNGKINEIHIIPSTEGSAYFYKNVGGQLILGFQSHRSVNVMVNQMVRVSSGALEATISQVQANNSVQLASFMPASLDMKHDMKFNFGKNQTRVVPSLAQSPKSLESKIISARNRLAKHIVAGSRNHVHMSS